jgi:hypothetical protein
VTTNHLAVQALADLSLACDHARDASREAGEPAAMLLARLAVAADEARAVIERLTADARAAGR